jgi:hypothetical protein
LSESWRSKYKSQQQGKPFHGVSPAKETTVGN